MERNPKKPVAEKDPLRGLTPSDREKAEHLAAGQPNVAQAERTAAQQHQHPEGQPYSEPHVTQRSVQPDDDGEDKQPKRKVHPDKDEPKHGHGGGHGSGYGHQTSHR